MWLFALDCPLVWVHCEEALQWGSHKQTPSNHTLHDVPQTWPHGLEYLGESELHPVGICRSIHICISIS